MSEKVRPLIRGENRPFLWLIFDGLGDDANCVSVCGSETEALRERAEDYPSSYPIECVERQECCDDGLFFYGTPKQKGSSRVR